MSTDNKLANSKDISAYLAKNPFVLAPMVDHSDLPFRMLTRRYGAGLCFTPMIHARLFSEDEVYRSKIFKTVPSDRPLVCQIAGDDPKVMLKTAQLLESKCDIIDINFGCPQGIARRGNYGSFLLENEAKVLEIVSYLSSNLRVPLACKIRLFKDRERTYRLVKDIEKAGCQLLTVHGRTREQNKELVGETDFEAIKTIKSILSIPVISNGGISCFEDTQKVLKLTGCDGVMSAEAILEYPALFSPNGLLDMDELVSEYLECVEEFPDQEHFVKSHLFKMLYSAFREHFDLRDKLSQSATLSEYKEVAKAVKARRAGKSLESKLGWYFRHRKAKTEDQPTDEASQGTQSESKDAKMSVCLKRVKEDC